MAKPLSPEFLTTQETADLLKIQRNTIERWRSQNIKHIPFSRCGKSVRYSLADIIKFMEKNKEGKN